MLDRFGEIQHAMDVSFLLGVLAQTLSIYTIVLIVRVLLSWFPNLDWGNPVLSAVSSITDPYLNICLLYTSPSPRD